MIKNVVFDMGQVIIKFDPNFFIERIGINDIEDKEVLMREVYKTVEWAMMDRGTLTPEEACSIMQDRVPEHLKDAVRELTCNWVRPIIPIQGSDKLVNELKEKGYKLILLTNAASNQIEYWPTVPCHDKFDGVIVSCLYGLVKPQPEIFKLTCDKYGLIPEETLFIDDSIVNCEGAVFSGLHAIPFHGDYQEIRKKMRALGMDVEE